MPARQIHVLRQRLLPVSCLLLALMPGVSLAQLAFTTGVLDLFAGPDRRYPVVVRMPPGAPVRIGGCIAGWSWCDVEYAGARGWAYGPGLSYTYGGARVPFYTYAPRLGIPIVTFSVGNYWDRYYRGRPWYPQRERWMHHPPHHVRPPPRPAIPHHPVHGAPGPRPDAHRPEVQRPDIHRPPAGAPQGRPQPPRPGPGQPDRHPGGPARPGAGPQGPGSHGQGPHGPGAQGPGPRPGPQGPPPRTP